MLQKTVKSLTLLCIVVLCAVVTKAMVQASTTPVTALWDFQHANPSSLSGVKIERAETHVASTAPGISMFVIAKSGKFAMRTSDAQLNANTYLRIPVKSTADVVTIVSYPGYHNYTIGGTAATKDTETHRATSAEVSQGFVQVQATATTYLYSVKVVQQQASSAAGSTTPASSGTVATATWDFAGVKPATLSGTTIEGKQGRVASTLNGISMYVIGQYGKFAQRTDDAQFNAKTALRIPVTAAGDVVTVTSATGYHNYTVGGAAATADKTTYTATAADVAQGYVVIFGTGSSYLKSISVVLHKYTAPSSNTGSASGSGSNASSGSTTATSNSTTASASFTAVSQNFYVVTAGSASSFLKALAAANANTSSGRKYIFLPNGTYNLGTTCLTAITGNNISIIGQSMDGTIIRNAPATANEGISTTATLLNKGTGNYFQDLTIQNALDYYNAGAAGRAVTLQDKGNQTICKNVRLLSYQDTYYSANNSGKYYFEDCDIHGTVDFICGGGDVFFNRTTLTVEPRSANGSGSCTIAAPYTESAWGYVFNDCRIQNKAASYTLGRAWGGTPRLAYINTTVNDTKMAASRFTTAGMNVAADKFVEYHTTNGSGKVVSPASNVLTFTKGSVSRKMETILTADQAKGYALNKVFTTWTPNEHAAQLTMSALSQSGNTLKWNAVKGASSYAIFKDGSLVAIVTGNATSHTITASGTYTVRASNPMGGFGKEASLKATVQAGGNTPAQPSTPTTPTQPSTPSGSTIAGMSSYDLNAPVGWGTVKGSITGSGNRNPVTVTTASELVAALSGTDAKTIYVKGTLTFDGQMSVNGGQNKTVYGLPGSVLSNPTHTATVAKTGILALKNCKNIILRNLTFKAAGAYDIDGNDNLTVQGCTYMWVDHCDFQDGVDGNFDCNNGSDNISVTWCRFRYLIKPWSGGSGGSNDHRFSDLWGGSDKNVAKDGGKLNTTFANCWWDEGCRERMPRVRFGKIHIVNCLYSSSVTSYCVGAGYSSNVFVENTAFTSANAKKYPWKSCATSSGYKDYNVAFKGCLGAPDVQSRSGSNAYFNPYSYYAYTPYDVTKVESQVSAHAGATLKITVGGGVAGAKLAGMDGESTVTAIEAPAATAEITAVRYYNANGVEVAQPTRGMNIVRTTYSDGRVATRKIMVR